MHVHRTLKMKACFSKNIDYYKSCTVSKHSIFACFLPICFEIKAHTAARFVTSEYIFCVIRCEQYTQRISSCKFVFLSYSVPMKMNLNDTTPYFQEVGGVTKPLISYKR